MPERGKLCIEDKDYLPIDVSFYVSLILTAADIGRGWSVMGIER
jgi:hypothetical protein